MRFGPAARAAVVLVALLVLVRLLGSPWRGGYELIFPDSFSYVEAARAPWWPRLWFNERAPGYPLIIWLVGPEPRRLAVVQAFAALGAWTWLGHTAWNGLRRRWIAVPCVGALALVAIDTRWVFWHTQVLTESVSATLVVAATAAWWRWAEVPTNPRLLLATTLVAGWMLIRDSNALSVAIVAGGVLVAAAARRGAAASGRRLPGTLPRGVLIAATVLMIVASYTSISHATSDRGRFSFHNNVGLRFLGDERMSGYLESHGMPMSDALRDRTGSDAWADGEAFLSDPELAGYRSWASGIGQTWGLISLATQADWYVAELWDWMGSGTGDPLLGYDAYHVSERFPERPLLGLGPTDSRPAASAWGVLVLAALGVLFVRRRRMAWTMGALLAVTALNLYLSFAGDAIEVGRHVVGALQAWAVLAICVVSLAADELLVDRERADE